MGPTKSTLEKYWDMAGDTTDQYGTIQDFEALLRQNPGLNLPHVPDFRKWSKDKATFVKRVLKFNRDGKKHL